MFATLIAFTFMFFFADSTGVPPMWIDIITTVVGLGLTVWLKFGPTPSRLVGAIGAAAGLFGVLSPHIVTMFPEGSHIGIILAVLGFALALISERIQGGVTVHEKRVAAVNGEM